MVADVDKELRVILSKKKFNIGEVVINLEVLKVCIVQILIEPV